MKPGWTEVALGEVCTVSMGQAPPGDSYNRDGRGLPLIAGAGDFIGSRTEAHKYTTAPTRVCGEGDIVLAIRASIGERAWADDRYCLGRGVAGLRAGPGLEQTFLWHWLDATKAELKAKGRGATFLQVNRGDIGEMRLPLPPIEEQRRIAAILDKADELRAKRRAALAHLDSLTQAIFLDMFGDPIANPLGWSRRPLGLVGEVITGNTPPRSRRELYGNDIEWVKSDNIDPVIGRVRAATEGLSKDGRRHARIAPAGSILVTCIAGSRASIGNAAVVDREVAFNQQINALVPVKDEASYLVSALRIGQDLVRGASTGGMKGLVSKSRFAAIEVPIPPTDMQRDFSSRVASVQLVRVRAAEGKTQLDALFASLQSRAFRGEL